MFARSEGDGGGGAGVEKGERKGDVQESVDGIEGKEREESVCLSLTFSLSGSLALVLPLSFVPSASHACAVWCNTSLPCGDVCTHFSHHVRDVGLSTVNTSIKATIRVLSISLCLLWRGHGRSV